MNTTPGDWRSYGNMVYAPDYQTLGKVNRMTAVFNAPTAEESTADATLAAVAPELLKDLLMAVRSIHELQGKLEDCGVDTESIIDEEMLVVDIGKATGQIKPIPDDWLCSKCEFSLLNIGITICGTITCPECASLYFV